MFSQMKMNLDFNKGGVVLLPTKTEKQVFEKSLMYVSTLKKGCGFIPEINAACDKALEGLQAILDKLQESEADDEEAATTEAAPVVAGKKAPVEPPPSAPEDSIEGMLDPDEGTTTEPADADAEESVQDEEFEEFEEDESGESTGDAEGDEFVDDEEEAAPPAPAPAKAAPAKAAPAAAAKPMTLEQRKAALLAGKAKK